MKRVLTLLICGILCLGSFSTTAFASNLSDVLEENQMETQPQDNTTNAAVTGGATDNSVNNSNDGAISREDTQSYLDTLNEASKIQAPNETVKKVNQSLSKVISIIVNVLSYGITIGLTLRVILDLCFIALPFTRTFLGNGYMGNGNIGNNMQQGGMNGMGMGGMGMNGMGMGGMNRMGMNGMGMNRMGGMGGMNSMGMQQGNQGMSPSATGRLQWVSTAALNAVEAENVPTPDGRARSAIKTYVSDMIVTLVAVPILLILAMSGVLTQLGLLIGEALASGIGALGGML